MERARDKEKESERRAAVGRLRHCDANVSNRPSQPTICPFVRNERQPRRCTEMNMLNLTINHYCVLMTIAGTLS